jgi:hypothetical protein
MSTSRSSVRWLACTSALSARPSVRLVACGQGTTGTCLRARTRDGPALQPHTDARRCAMLWQHTPAARSRREPLPQRRLAVLEVAEVGRAHQPRSSSSSSLDSISSLGVTNLLYREGSKRWVLPSTVRVAAVDKRWRVGAGWVGDAPGSATISPSRALEEWLLASRVG